MESSDIIRTQMLTNAGPFGEKKHGATNRVHTTELQAGIQPSPNDSLAERGRRFLEALHAGSDWSISIAVSVSDLAPSSFLCFRGELVAELPKQLPAEDRSIVLRRLVEIK